MWQCNWYFLISAAWKTLNRHCFSSEKVACSFSIFSWVLSNHTMFMIRKLKNSEHDFFEWTHSLYLLNLSEIIQDFFCLAQWSQKNNIWTFFTRINWVREKWSRWYFDMMKKTSWDKKLKKKINIIKLIESKKIMWHVKHVKHWESKSWECSTLVLSMSNIELVKHVKQIH